jgi:hypothetical protein
MSTALLAGDWRYHNCFEPSTPLAAQVQNQGNPSHYPNHTCYYGSWIQPLPPHPCAQHQATAAVTPSSIIGDAQRAINPFMLHAHHHHILLGVVTGVEPG